MKTSTEMLMKSVDASNDVAREMAGFVSSKSAPLVSRSLDFARRRALRLENTDLAQAIDRAQRHGKNEPGAGSVFRVYVPFRKDLA
jgi:hypothetical protein